MYLVGTFAINRNVKPSLVRISNKTIKDDIQIPLKNTAYLVGVTVAEQIFIVCMANLCMSMKSNDQRWDNNYGEQDEQTAPRIPSSTEVHSREGFHARWRGRCCTMQSLHIDS